LLSDKAKLTKDFVWHVEKFYVEKYSNNKTEATVYKTSEPIGFICLELSVILLSESTPLSATGVETTCSFLS